MRNESSRQIQPRIMMYSQDGLGLGHMRRTSSIANQIAQVRPDAAILTMADSQLGQFFETSKNHDYLKLPSILKAGPGDWRAVSLPLPFADVHAMRRELIRSAVLTYQPHILLVDHMPHGAMGELIPTLEALRASGAPTRIVLGLRDILDAPEVVRQRWLVEGAYDAKCSIWPSSTAFRPVWPSGCATPAMFAHRRHRATPRVCVPNTSPARMLRPS